MQYKNLTEPKYWAEKLGQFIYEFKQSAEWIVSFAVTVAKNSRNEVTTRRNTGEIQESIREKDHDEILKKNNQQRFIETILESVTISI